MAGGLSHAAEVPGSMPDRNRLDLGEELHRLSPLLLERRARLAEPTEWDVNIPARCREVHGDLAGIDVGLVVVLEFDWNVIRRRLEQIVESCAAPTWSQSVLQLQRFFRWEYEDYTTEGEAGL